MRTLCSPLAATAPFFSSLLLGLQDVLLLWDYIFSYRHRLQPSSASDLQASIEVIAVSMVRPHLLAPKDHVSFMA